MDRAYALLTVKALDAERRTIAGIASTPEPNRMGDVVEPLGITYKNPLPLLLYHDTHQPVGTVTFAPTAEGLAFEATLPTVAETGTLRDRIEEAWQSIKAGLFAGVSIGFRPLEPPTYQKTIRRFARTEILELSLVTIPANAHASIHTIKSLDLAAPGLHSSRARDTLPIVRLTKGAPAMTIPEQITALENRRAANVARMNDIQTKCATEGRSKDDTEREEFSTLQVDVKTIDGELVDARAMEQINITQAKAVVPAAKAVPVITVKPNVPPGMAFVRMACAKLVCNGNMYEAAEYAKRWNDSTPEVALALKAAVAAGTVTDATWAAPLVNQNIANDFIELLRPATIMGKIPNWRRVPFNHKVPAQTAGGTYGWVGEAKPKPVTKLAFSAVTLDIAKAAGIIVLTEELVRLSNPSAEALVRADMIAGIAQFLDAQLIDPAVVAVAGVNPASITNGAGTAVATTDPLADVLTILRTFSAANIPIAGAAIIMSEGNALALAFRRNASGDRLFPDMTPTGGTIDGITVVASSAAAGLIIGVQPSMILLADEGGVNIDASREASLQMDSAPDSPAVATTVLVSLWQHNLVGLRAERFVNWKRVAAAAVYYLTAAAYPAPSAAATAATPTHTSNTVGVIASIRSALARTIAPAAPVAGTGGGWQTIVRESFPGAWQQNVEVRQDSVLTYFAVFACVTLIASDIGKLCLRLVKQTEDDVWIAATSPAFSPVLRKPNRYQAIAKFVEQWITSKLIWGNAFVLKERDNRGVVVALYVLDPGRVTPLVAPDGSVYYELARHDLAGGPLEGLGDTVILPAREIIHDTMVCLYHPLVGVSPIFACGLAAMQGLSIQNSSTKFFTNGSRPSGVLVVPAGMKAEQLAQAKADWETFNGPDNAGKVAVIASDVKYTQLTMNAVDAELIGQLKWTADTVCSCYHVAPYMIGVGDPPPYANVEPLLQQYYSQCIQSLLVNFEKSLDEGLGLLLPIDGTQYGTEFDIDDLIWMDTATKTKAAGDSIGGGGMSPDEARRKYFGLGPVSGGHTPYMQQQMFSLEALAKRDAEDPFAKPTPAPVATPAEGELAPGQVAATVRHLLTKALETRAAA